MIVQYPTMWTVHCSEFLKDPWVFIRIPLLMAELFLEPYFVKYKQNAPGRKIKKRISQWVKNLCKVGVRRSGLWASGCWGIPFPVSLQGNKFLGWRERHVGYLPSSSFVEWNWGALLMTWAGLSLDRAEPQQLLGYCKVQSDDMFIYCYWVTVRCNQMIYSSIVAGLL